MATVAGFYIGSAIGGPVLGPVIGAIGAAIGSAADGIALGRLLSEDPPNGKLGAFTLNYADEGAPLVYGYGSRLRISGQMIFASRPWSLSAGGGSGKRKEPVQLTWYGDVVYLLTANELKRISRLDFDGETVYSDAPSQTFSALGIQYGVYLDAVNSVQAWQWNPSANWWELVVWYLTVENAFPNNIGNELLAFRPGLPITLRYKTGAGVEPVHSNPAFGGSKIGQFPLRVVEARVAGYYSGGPTGIIARRRLVVDLEGWWRPFATLYRNTGTGPPPLGQPTLLPTSLYPLSPWPPTSMVLEFTQAGVTWTAGAVNNNSSHLQLGASTDPVNTVYATHAGTTKAPLIPRVAKLGLKDVNWSRYGNRAPQVVAFCNESSATIGVERSIGYVIDKIMNDRARIAGGGTSLSGDFSTLSLSGQTCYGYSFPGLQSTTDTLAPLLLAFDIHTRRRNGRLEFIDGADRSQITLLTSRLDARVWGSPPSDPIRVTGDPDQADMPLRVSVRFPDINRDLQLSSIADQRDSVNGLGNGTRQVDLPISMDAVAAKIIARRVLRDTNERRTPVEFSLPATHEFITETDILRFDNYQGTTWYVVVESVDVSADDLVNIRGYATTDPPAVSQPTGFLVAGSTPTTESPRGLPDAPPLLLTFLLDVPPLRDSDMRTPGVYVATAAPGATYHAQARLERALGAPSLGSITDPEALDWHDVGAAPEPSTVGKVVGLLPAPMQLGIVDYSADLVVDLLGPEASGSEFVTATETDVLGGANLGAVRSGNGEWEVVQWTTAAQEDHDEIAGGRRWRLRGLRRALRGTEAAARAHAVGVGVLVVLDVRRLTFLPIDSSAVGSYLTVRSRGTDSDFSGPIAQVVTSLRSSLPLPVGHLAASRGADGSVTISWVRRTRSSYRTFGLQSAPLVEGSTAYDVVINPATTNRTINVGAASATYTAAQMSTDGTTNAELTVVVYQVDAERGRGQAATITVMQTSTGLRLDDDSGYILADDGRRLIL